MQERLESLEDAFGELDQRVVRLERTIYPDPQAGTEGDSAQLRRVVLYINDLRATLRTLNWLIAFAGVSGVGMIGALWWLIYTVSRYAYLSRLPGP